jgi:hypothetical protein
LLLVAAAALPLAVRISASRDGAAARAGVRYACPMHPQATAGVPGDCPICGMALEREVAPRDAVPTASATFVAAVERRVLAEPVRAPAWLTAAGLVTAVLHKDDIVGLSPGDRATFFGGGAPAVGVEARLEADPPAPVDASTCKVHFRIDCDAGAPDVDRGVRDVGSIALAAHPRALLVVPTSAVLYSTDGPYVLAASRPGDAFAKQPVEIGRILDSSSSGLLAGGNLGAVVVLSGVREGDRVVARDTFFVDAERRLQIARGWADEVRP